MAGLKAFVLVLMICSFNALAHNGIDHTQRSPTPHNEVKALKEINEIYLSEVKPIFERKCLDCHGNSPMPWYHHLPIIKGMMDEDVKEAKEHLDMSKDFPFGGHGSPKEDLQAIKESIKESTMPPLKYKVMHWSSVLSKKEKKTIHHWIDESLQILEGGSLGR